MSCDITLPCCLHQRFQPGAQQAASNLCMQFLLFPKSLFRHLKLLPTLNMEKFHFLKNLDSGFSWKIRNSGNTGPAFLHGTCCWSQVAAVPLRHVLSISPQAPPLPTVLYHRMLPWPLLAFDFETLIYAFGVTWFILVLVLSGFLSLMLPSWMCPWDPTHSKYGLEDCELSSLRGQRYLLPFKVSGRWLLTLSSMQRDMKRWGGDS